MDQRLKPHAIIIPLPHQGHINPTISLALKLASKGFAITFINLEFVQDMISKSSRDNVDLFFEARKSGLDVHCRTISDGFPLEFDRGLYLIEFWDSMLQDFSTRVDQLVGKIIGSDPYSAHFLVADSLYAWPARIAKKYNIVSVSYWTEPALVFSLTYHSELLREKGHFPCKDGIEEEINYIPGIESINTKDFMPYLKQSDIATLSYRLVHSAFKDLKNADFIVHNTVQELESQTLSALNKYQPNYAIGPVGFSNDIAKITVFKSLWSESNCSQWLESKPPGSVLYVSFGSLVQTSKEVIEEIAHGLRLSRVSFIWVIRPGVAGSEDVNSVPDGVFGEEVRDRGLVVPWCDQIMVLSNPAVGGFVTHCGWNSILESIWFGVPMICYPITYDQPTNRKLVVDDWKVGINLCDGKLVDRNEIAEKIKEVMSGKFNQDMETVSAKLKNALQNDGSSETNFDQFVVDLKAKIYDSIVSEVNA